MFYELSNTRLQEPHRSVVGAVADADLADGNLYIADAMQGDIKAFHKSGHAKHVIGRRGNGPAELQVPTAVVALPNGKVAALDPRRKRLVWFDTTGVYVQEAQVDLSNADDLAYWEQEQVIVISGSRGGHLGVLMLDTLGKSLAFMRIPSEPPPTPFGKVSVSAAGGSLFAIRRDSSAIWRARSDTHRFDPWKAGQTPDYTVSWPRHPMKSRRGMDAWYRKQTWTDGVLGLSDSLAILRFLSFKDEAPIFEHIIIGGSGEWLTSSTVPIQGRDSDKFWSVTLDDDGEVHLRTFHALFPIPRPSPN